ncbi:MAG: hypothetical protein AAGB10_13025 [Pseudomonadota bacterium]
MRLTYVIAFGLMVAGCDTAYAQYSWGARIGDTNVTKASTTSRITAANGMTLYTFDKDQNEKSNCYGNCEVNWPPFVASSNAVAPGNGYSIIERRDGTQQWAKNGAPLYFWVGDQKPGDTNGDGVGGLWHIAR